MQALRQIRSLTRFVLVWFALFIGVASAAPLIGVEGVQMVCTGAGVMKIVNQSDDGSLASTATGMDCPLCASVAPIPVPPVMAFAPARAPNAHRIRFPQWVPVWHSAPSLPSRGPPLIAG